MARSNKPIHESVLRGGIEHGQEFTDEPPLDATNEELGDYDDDEGEQDNTSRTPSELDLMRRELDMLKQQNAHLQRLIPPPAPVQTLDSSEDDDDTDWDNLIFSNPKEAVKKIEDRAVARAEKKLRKEYQQEQGETKFWSEFYEANKDLKQDADLVEATLQSNLAKLADLPVPQAMEQLADLTRQRIMRYSGGRDKPKSRAVAEGASPPSKRAPEQKPARPTTLSDIIRNRSERRRKAASAA